MSSPHADPAPEPHTTEAAPGPFDAAARRRHWHGAAAEPVDLLVIGGGITGAGIAFEAAGRGLRVAMVEAGDWGSGTSSRSSRLIHGGLRYLETFDFALVFEALGERRRLRELAPHLVRPLPFLFPVYAGSNVGMVKLAAGMWLYDGLSLFRGFPRHRMLSRSAVIVREPGLRRVGLRGGAIYYDAQVDDARLTLAVARAAHEAGAHTISYARVVEFIPGAEGRIAGVRVRDEVSGSVAEIRARLVLSAAGPWTDEIRALAAPGAKPRLRPTKGVHLMFSRERVGNEGAIIFRSPVDGRTMFVLPWGPFTYVGTTDTDYTGSPADATVDEGDIAYLLDSANGIYPAANLTREDVVGSWAGVRPLLVEPDADDPGDTSREHSIWREENGLLCIAGGKLTTYRPMAADAVDEAAAILEREHGIESGDFHSGEVPLPGTPDEPWDTFAAAMRARARALAVADDIVEHLLAAYGGEAMDVLDRVERDPSLGIRAVDRLPYIRAEIDHAIAQEMAMTADDILTRRLHVAYETREMGDLEARIQDRLTRRA